jgi:hypothetical protein
LDITRNEDKPEILVTLDIAQDEDKKPKQTNTVRKATKMSNTDTTKNTRGEPRCWRIVSSVCFLTAMTLTWYRHFPKKWWVESDFTAPNLPLALGFKGS